MNFELFVAWNEKKSSFFFGDSDFFGIFAADNYNPIKADIMCNNFIISCLTSVGGVIFALFWIFLIRAILLASTTLLSVSYQLSF